MKQAVFSRAGDAQARGDESSLRPAVTRLFFETSSRSIAGFGLPAVPRSSAFIRTLTTVALALYPVFAAAGVIIAGLLLGGSHIG